MTGLRPPWFRFVPPIAALAILAGAAPPARAADCNANGIEDACDLDCGPPGEACDVPGCGSSDDCDGNGIPDECDLAVGATGCPFPTTIIENTTGGDPALMSGPPDDLFWGVGGQIVTYEFDCGLVYDGPGPDLTVYEVDSGTAEFGYIDVLVSADGIGFVSVKSAEMPVVRIPGDETHGNNSFARSYDLDPSGLTVVRYVRIDGSGTGAGGASTGFDLDAIGAIHRLGRDCDSSGVLDSCEPLPDCDANGIPDSCWLAAGLDPDCNANGAVDVCDVTSLSSDDCDADLVPDECEPDCNSNGVADACDVDPGASDDCNANLVPDECDLATAVFSIQSDPLAPMAYGFPQSFSVLSAFAAAGDVTLTVEARGDFEATNEYLDVTLNGTAVGRLLDTGAAFCAATVDSLTVPAGTFNDVVHGGDAVFAFTAPSYVSPVECLEPTVTVTVQYAAVVDCNLNGALDHCDIESGTSTDLNVNGIADDCEADCNGNAAPDDYDIAQGTSVDCNINEVPDECDVDSGTSDDCNANIVPDECEPDCNSNGVADECDIAWATSPDCDLNAIPDECDLYYAADGCPFPFALVENTSGGDDLLMTGPPDDLFWGLGGQIVTYEWGCGFVADGPGPDITVYEVDGGVAEFNLLADVLVSDDGLSFVSVKSSETAAVAIPGDEVHGSSSFARSYDLSGTDYRVVRYVRLDGSGTGAGGPSTGFDLDAIGAVHRIGRDCDSSGALDVCETQGDCDANLLPDACEIALDPDCNVNGVLDECDISSGASTDYNLNGVPDDCEPDCNGNARPDDYDIAQGDSSDCNHNAVPDECDLAGGTSLDCNDDLLPDECPICPPVEVAFVMDVSTSMEDEGAALCSKISQVAAELQADLIDVDNELLAIMAPGTGIFSCLTESVVGNYGTIVPGDPPPDNEILGACPGGLEVGAEDWGRATSVVAGNKPWLTESVRLVVPLSDEGPWCGEPTTDPGVDRDSILHAIGVAQENDVTVSPVTCSGSTSAMVALAQLLADSTGGQRFSSTLPADDLAAGIKSIIVDACDAVYDCNGNDVPDECDLASGTSQDCDLDGTPDECQGDCNGNGIADSCDIDWGTSQDWNANLVPDECEAIQLTLDAADLLWTGVDSAVGYDVICGDLQALSASYGDFGTSTTGCAANDHPALTLTHATEPPPLSGQGYWYLVRGVLGALDLSYDTFTAAQAAPRDASIATSAEACP